MINEKMNIKCESIFSDDRMHRYLWKRVWDKDKPLAAVIMLNPCMADNIVTDTTTSLVVNNIAKMEYHGGVVILNLFSRLTNKLNFRWNSFDDLNTPDNDYYIKKTADECETVILAWGKAEGTNQRIAARATQVLAMLQGHREKLFVITDGTRSGLHPLTPCLRNQWRLEPFREAEKAVAQEASTQEGESQGPAEQEQASQETAAEEPANE